MGIGMKHEIDAYCLVARQLKQGGSDGLKPLAPAFTPMTGDQQPEWATTHFPRGHPRCDPQQSVDPGVAGDMDFARHPLVDEIRAGKLGRCEQQLGPGVDRSSKFLFRPGERRIMRAQAGLDMSDRHAGEESGKRRPECTRSIALDEEQIRPGEEEPTNR
jgi:hypothetical protein